MAQSITSSRHPVLNASSLAVTDSSDDDFGQEMCLDETDL
jgi:hypothetical protein